MNDILTTLPDLVQLNISRSLILNKIITFLNNEIIYEIEFLYSTFKEINNDLLYVVCISDAANYYKTKYKIAAYNKVIRFADSRYSLDLPTMWELLKDVQVCAKISIDEGNPSKQKKYVYNTATDLLKSIPHLSSQEYFNKTFTLVACPENSLFYRGL